MAAAMSVRDEKEYDAIVVVGGGCYGSYYVRQLERARAAGAIQYNRILVVDRSTQCQVAGESTGAELVVSEWRDFFSSYLASASGDTRDAIVPSPLMPHLMYGWLLNRASARWPGRVVATRSLTVVPETPWQSKAPDGTHYASYAAWTCPINCIEPRRCPHTGGERYWTMPAAARDVIARAQTGPEPLQGPVIFHCTHRAFGVGMFDTGDVVAADEFVKSVVAQSGASVLVGTVSHCHGAFNVLHVGAATS